MSYTNDVAALNPENWSDMIQENLYKEVIAFEVADTKFKSKLTKGTQVHFPMFGALAVTAYVKGADVTVQALDSTDEYLTVDQQWESSFYLDTIDQKQNLYSAMEAGVREATDALKQKVDTLFLAQVLNAYDTFDAGDMSTGSAGDAVTLTGTNVAEFFSGARAKLGKALKGKQAIAVVDYALASLIEQKAFTTGFSIADSTFKNGYAGDFLGWKIYVSENLDSTTDSRVHAYMGAAKMISLVMQIAPTTQIDNDPLKFGRIVKILEVFGLRVFSRQGERFLEGQYNI